MFSRLKRQLSVYAPLGAGLLIITLATALSGLWHYQHEVSQQSPTMPALGKAAAVLESNPAAAGTAGGVSSAVTAYKAQGQTARSSQTSVPAAQKSGTAATKTGNQPAAAATAIPSSVTVDLNVNHQDKGRVVLQSGSNQCQVLSGALSQGVINNLDMRYSSQYNSEAVYVIDGQGDPGTVWWTYTVNGSPPPYGCSYMSVHNGDSINWQYVKS